MRPDIERIAILDLVKNEKQIAEIAAALANPIRRKIIIKINEKQYTITELSELLNIPDSTISFHVNYLVKCGILNVVNTKHKKGNEKRISLGSYFFSINLGVPAEPKRMREMDEYTFSLPIGSYTKVDITPPCGLQTKTGNILSSDIVEAFYSPNRFNAILIWVGSGTIEYVVPLKGFDRKNSVITKIIKKQNIAAIKITLEICSECPNYDEKFRSDITFWLDDKEIGTYECPGDYGGRRGKHTPEHIPINDSQFGNLVAIEVKEKGTYINNTLVSKINIADLDLANKNIITLKFGNKNSSRYKGGFNLFGKGCGDYSKDIEFTVFYYKD